MSRVCICDAPTEVTGAGERDEVVMIGVTQMSRVVDRMRGRRSLSASVAHCGKTRPPSASLLSQVLKFAQMQGRPT